MKSEPFNPVQLHLLKMFSYAKDERALEEIRKSLTAYFAQRVVKQKAVPTLKSCWAVKEPTWRK